MGDIKGDGAIEIAGRVEGDVKCLSIKLLKGSVINGDVIAEKAEIHGEVKGNVTAKSVSCGATAKIVGDITHQRIHITDGAYIDGNCKKFIYDNTVKLLTEVKKEEVVEAVETEAEEVKQAS